MDLHVERNRLRTFELWNVSFIDKNYLALLGFYYYSPPDLVRCVFCGVEIGRWEEGDDALADHKKWSPFCIFINRNRNYTRNVPIDEGLLNQILPPSPSPNIFKTPEISTNTVSEGTNVNLNFIYGECGIEAVISKGFNLEFANKVHRFQSYDDWPKTLRSKAEQLTEAGFYYTGCGDRVICFSCGGGLRDWEINDDPWEQHALWYANCQYLKVVKGSEYIKKIHIDQSLSTAAVSKNHQRNILENSNVHEEKLCKVCYTTDYNTIFQPCGHIYACITCATKLKIKKCPMCRQPFTKIQKIFFP
jgi:baculoviral IAP repeat-containing protein 7/8